MYLHSHFSRKVKSIETLNYTGIGVAALCGSFIERPGQ